MVVVTGASAGVGRATALAFAARGDRVALLSRGGGGLEPARREAEAAGADRAVALPVDIADAGAVEAAAEEVERALGPIDVWVNVAMLSVFSPVAETTADEVRRVTEATYLGSVHGVMAALRRMTPRDRGAIVQVGSALGHRAIPLQAPYCAAKHAIRAFVDSLRCELIHDGSGVTVTTVELPAMDTPQFGWVRTRLPGHPRPVPPVYAPEVAARAIVGAADRGPRDIWVGAPTMKVILGSRLLPAGLFDRHLARTGFSSQQMDEPVEPDRRDNLDAPLPDDRGTRGRFGDEVRTRSPLTWVATHAGPLLAGACALAAAAGAAARWRR